MRVALVNPSCSGLFYGYQLYITLMAPNVWLLSAKGKFVRDDLDLGHAKWYALLVVAGLFGCKWLYQLAGVLIRSRRWQRRAIEAVICNRSIRENP